MLNDSASWKKYACRYYHAGKWWSLDLVAESEADAQARAQKLGNLQLLGEIKAEFPAKFPAAGIVARVFVALANRITRH